MCETAVCEHYGLSRRNELNLKLKGECFMRISISLILALCLFVSTGFGVVLPGKWDRLTCRVVTDSLTGTGFLLRYRDKVFIVTNRHMVDPGKSKFFVGLNTKLFDSTQSNADSSGAGKSDVRAINPSAGMYFMDEEYDLAFVHITDFIVILDVTLFPESAVGDDSMIIAGREIFFLGYPGGMYGYNPRTPLVRGGIIAGDSKQVFFLDGNVFGGSSGSPVCLDVDLENDVRSQYLIGVISELKTTATKSHPTVQENMGIGLAIKISYIRKAIENWIDNQ